MTLGKHVSKTEQVTSLLTCEKKKILSISAKNATRHVDPGFEEI